MRLLFVSNTMVGGSGRSQRELAARLRERGHEVTFLVDDDTHRPLTRWVYGHLSDASVRLARTPLRRIIRRLELLPGRRSHETEFEGLRHVVSPVPENAAERVIADLSPDVVIGSSILRLTWRRVRETCAVRSIPTVLYVREVEAMNHFDDGCAPANSIVANAESLAATVEGFGYTCPVFPSVIEVGVTATESQRLVALAINPIESRGVSTIWALAERRPAIRFVVQESWPLRDEELAEVEANCNRLPNVEFRRVEAPGPRLYRDARVLLVPYRVDNRPRVIAEAQANGIPVVVANSPALVEATGAGGLIVPIDDLEAWCNALDLLWSDPSHYETLSASALTHSQRAEISAPAITARFEALLSALVAR